MNDNKAPFWRLLCSRAYADTKKFWTANRIITAVAAPVFSTGFASVSWIGLRGWKGSTDLFPVLGLSILVFIGLVLLTFLASLIQAPASLYRDLQSKVNELEQRLPRKWSAAAGAQREELLKQIVALKDKVSEIRNGELCILAADHNRIISLKNVAPNSPEEGEINDHYARLETVQTRFRGLVRDIGEALQNAATLSAESARLSGEFRTARLEVLDRRLPQDVLARCGTARNYLDALDRELSTD